MDIFSFLTRLIYGILYILGFLTVVSIFGWAVYQLMAAIAFGK